MELKTLTNVYIPPEEDCTYTACYCEENVWKLCEHVQQTQSHLIDLCYAVFISNKNQVIPIWKQKTGTGDDNLVMWDYHVIFLVNLPEKCFVYDFDSTLHFPINFSTYATLSFRPDILLKPEYYRKFRIVQAEVFLKEFASDRSKMKRPDGTWIKPPPQYPCIQNSGSRNNIDDFINMDPAVGFGDVLDLDGFMRRFS